jgi:hypothetical protein
LFTRRKSPTRSVFSIDDVGILKASTKNVRTPMNRTSAMATDRVQ